MSSKTTRWFLLSLLSLIFITGCQCSDSQIDIMEVILDSPVGEVVSSLLPTFSWHNSEDCQPDYYHLYIKENTESGGGLNFNTPDDNTTYTISGTPLEPGKEYAWIVEAREEEYGPSDWSEPSLFYTGPVCSGETLIAPVLQSPQDSAWLMGATEFNWIYNGGCLPDHYHYEFATDPGFTNVVSSGPTFEQYAQHVVLTFPNCSSLFWRVAANDGTTIGPWSASREFHYILDDTCYQWDYLSDDFAWISVHLFEDSCSQTGFLPYITETLDYGCVVDNDGMIIRGNGTYQNYEGQVHSFVADLGAGPCPSTGLDQKTSSWDATFGVLTPGTYCVSISRDQIVNTNSGSKDLMEGIWTSHDTYPILAQETIELGPGQHDISVWFAWDELDRPLLTFPLNKTYKCYIAPYTGCPIADFAMEGVTVPIFARDTNSDWKMSAINGSPCYIFLPSAEIDDRLVELGLGGYFTAKLKFFPKLPPCATPTPVPCASYNNSSSCTSAGCTWYMPVTGGDPYCKHK